MTPKKTNLIKNNNIVISIAKISACVILQDTVLTYKVIPNTR